MKVCAVTEGGAFAEEVVIRGGGVFKLPQNVDLEAAAGLPVAFGTAHLALVERARLQAGQTVLVLGAAGGVGVAAVQVQSPVLLDMHGSINSFPKLTLLGSEVQAYCIMRINARIKRPRGRIWQWQPFLSVARTCSICMRLFLLAKLLH